MGLFGNLNARLLAALQRRDGGAPLVLATVSPNGLRLQDAAGQSLLLPWHDVQRVVATRRDLFAGDETVLLIQTSAGQVLELGSSLAGWLDVCAALDALPNSEPSARWLARASAGQPGDTVRIWCRAPAAGRG